MSRIATPTNNLAVLFPDVAAEWHPTKNGDLTPDTVMPFSNKKVWWLGKCKHEWQASIGHRSKGIGCPVCSGRLIVSGINDFATLLPELLKEWHPTKNGALIPSSLSPGTKTKVWWLGPCGHEWESSINNRARGTSCPFCSNKKVLPGFNDLATLRPEIAAEWHPTKNEDLMPHMMTVGSDIKVWWQCSKGHEWKTTVATRTDGHNCPICSNNQVVAGINDLATTCPELATQWHPTKNGKLTPSMTTKNSPKKVWWICEKGHEWQATISNRYGQNQGCPYCNSKSVLAGFNDLSTRNPDLAAEWHPTKNGDLTPDKVMPFSSNKVWWLGKCGHEWPASISYRSSGGGCPYCSNKKVLPGFNDLLTIEPELAAQWHPTKNGDLLPSHIIVGTSHKVWWQCEKGHEWYASPHYRIWHRSCPVCSNRIVLPGYNDLTTTHPEIAAEWHPTKNGSLLPSQVIPNSLKKVWWFGKCGHEWQAVVHNRSFGAGCPACDKERRTSIPQTAILFYVSAIFPDAVSGQKFDWLGQSELDIYIPSLRIGIEYDGQVWHKDAVKDIRKNKTCAENNVRLIRVREPKCPPIPGENIILESVKNSANNTAIKVLLRDYLNYSGPLEVDIDRDRFKIYELLDYVEKENSLLRLYPDIAAQWHPTKNGNFNPAQVTKGSGKKVWWLCPKCGHEWEKRIADRTSCDIGCPQCRGRRVSSD